MKNKQITAYTTVLFMLICATIAWTQELNEKVISVDHLSYAKKPLAASIKSYAINVQGAMSADPSFPSIVKSKISIGDLSRVDDINQADLVVALQTGNLSIVRKEQGSRKDSQDVLQYYYTISYTLPIKVTLVTKEKVVLSEEQLYTEEFTFKTESYADPSALNFMYLSEAAANKVCMTKTIEKLQNYLNVNFGSQKTSYAFYLFTAKGKKLNYDQLNEALKTVKAIFKNDVVKKLSPEQATQLKGVESVWKNELNQADTMNTAARINAEVYYGLNFNLAFASLWLGNFDDASRYLELAKLFTRKKFYYFDYKDNIKKLENLLTEYKTVYVMNNPG